MLEEIRFLLLCRIASYVLKKRHHGAVHKTIVYAPARSHKSPVPKSFRCATSLARLALDWRVIWAGCTSPVR